MWKTLQESGGVGGVKYACTCVLFAEVNLWLMGLFNTSLIILRLRQRGDAPRDLDRICILENQVPLPMYTGGVIVILREESMEMIW